MQPPGGLRCNTLQILLSPQRPEVYNKKKKKNEGYREKNQKHIFKSRRTYIKRAVNNIQEFIKLTFYVFDAQGMV